MERSVKGLLAFGLVTFLAVCARPVHGIICVQAILQVLPCQPYLVGKAPAPSPGCCDAVGKLAKLAGSDPPACKELCTCFKGAAATFKVDPFKAHQLPMFCHFDVGVPIDPNIDCDHIVCKKLGV